MTQLYPYLTLRGVPTLGVTQVRLDGAVLPSEGISASEHVVSLHGADWEDWTEARLDVRVEIPERTRERWPDAAVDVLLFHRRTRVRTVVRLRPRTDVVWGGVVPIHRDHFVDQAELSAHVTATVDEVSGREIGSADSTWLIGSRTAKPSREEAMDSIWVDFEKRTDLYAYRADPWLIDTSGERPTIYLNLGFEGLEAVLRTGDKSLQRAVSAQIAADAWTAAFNTASATLNGDEGPVSWPEGWHGTVLRAMLPAMFEDLSPNESLVELAARRSSGDEGDLQTRVAHASARQAKLPISLGGLFRSVHRKESR